MAHPARPSARLLRASTLLACGALAPGCATAPPPAAKAPAPAPAAAGPGLRVEKVREGIVATPWEVFFSGVRGSASASEFVGVRNGGEQPVTITKVSIEGTHAETFKLAKPPELPKALVGTATLNVEVMFAPAAEAPLGVHRAVLVFTTNASEDGGVPVDLRALVTKGLEGENEPPLQQVVEALGYGVNVGGTALRLGTGAEPIGDEVKSPRFRRAKPGPVGIYPVARYSPDEPLPYGYYAGSEAPETTTLAAIAAGQHQTLNPELEPEGKTSFDPGDGTFGIWVKSAKHATYSEDRFNTGTIKHAVRVYPMKTGAGQPVGSTYLVCFEEAQNGDYNDYVFVLVNVQPAE
jgi:hypothetical protein